MKNLEFQRDSFFPAVLPETNTLLDLLERKYFSFGLVVITGFCLDCGWEATVLSSNHELD